MDFLLNYPEMEYILRFVLSAFLGGLIGLEREKRAKNAGIRTHILVAISSTLMMVVSKYGFFDVVSVEGISLDASRIAAGIVSAIGFLGTGVIFVRKETTIGLTTAAGLWATVGVGITIGSGLYVTGIAFTVFLLLIQLILHNKKIRGFQETVGTISLLLDDTERTTASVIATMESNGFTSVRNLYLDKKESGEIVLTARVTFNKNTSLSEILQKLENLGKVKSIDLNPSL